MSPLKRTRSSPGRNRKSSVLRKTKSSPGRKRSPSRKRSPGRKRPYVAYMTRRMYMTPAVKRWDSKKNRASYVPTLHDSDVSSAANRIRQAAYAEPYHYSPPFVPSSVTSASTASTVHDSATSPFLESRLSYSISPRELFT